MSLPLGLFPEQTPAYILSFQFSSWYPTFSGITIKSKIIRPVSNEFRDYLDSDRVIIPQGSEDVPAESTLSDDEGDEVDDSTDDEDLVPSYSFPELDSKIRECIKEYHAVFPKLNFTSPKDASWLLPASSPLKCTNPADIYLLLKSSDFITHDLSLDSVFEGCEKPWPAYDLELVLRKWYPVNTSREFRCFVRNNRLIAISQRDTNFCDFLNDVSTKDRIITALISLWNVNVKDKNGQGDYIFDILLTRDLSRGHILDFNPYAPRTDSLLFSYEELRDIAACGQEAPEYRVIDSRSHPAASSNVPVNQHNMMPYEAIRLSNGKDIEEFAEQWKNRVSESMQPDTL